MLPLGWLIGGLVVGIIASLLVRMDGRVRPPDLMLGVVAALLCGWFFSAFGPHESPGFGLYSLIVAVLGAAIVLGVYHLMMRRQ